MYAVNNRNSLPFEAVSLFIHFLLLFRIETTMENFCPSIYIYWSSVASFNSHQKSACRMGSKNGAFTVTDFLRVYFATGHEGATCIFILLFQQDYYLVDLFSIIVLGILQILFNFSIAFIKEKNLKKNLLYMQCLALGNQTTGTYLLMSLTLNYKTRYITCIKF